MKEVQQIHSICVVQKRLTNTGLRLLAIERSAKGCPLAGIWELRFPVKNGSPSLTCLCKQCGLCCIYTFLLESGILYAKQRVPMWPVPDKNSKYWVSTELPWQTFHVFCHGSLLEDLSVSWEKTFKSLCLVSSGLCPICLFPLLILLCILSLQ